MSGEVRCMRTGWAGVDRALRGVVASPMAAVDLHAVKHSELAREVEDGTRLTRREGRASCSRPHMSAHHALLRDAVQRYNSPEQAASTSDSQHVSGLVVAGVHEFLGCAGPPLGLLSRIAACAAAGAQHTGLDGADTVVWIGRRCWPDLLALARVGASQEVDLPAASLFVDPPDRAAGWWSAECAIRSGESCCVVLDGDGASLTCTRRLQRAAESSGTLVLLVRSSEGQRAPSAALTRWRVQRRPAPVGPGRRSWHGAGPRWDLELLRCRGRQSFVPSGDSAAVDRAEAGVLARWTLEWDGVRGPIDLSVAVPASMAIGPRSSTIASRGVA